eukprot:3879486-Ditylum_brightwellii.AAC.1
MEMKNGFTASKVVVAFSDCFDAMMNGDVNWEKQFKPPKSYPEEYSFLDSSGMLTPKHNTNEFLKMSQTLHTTTSVMMFGLYKKD